MNFPSEQNNKQNEERAPLFGGLLIMARAPKTLFRGRTAPTQSKANQKNR
jgi:hypothetical protein